VHCQDMALLWMVSSVPQWMQGTTRLSTRLRARRGLRLISSCMEIRWPQAWQKVALAPLYSFCSCPQAGQVIHSFGGA